mgnify:CR=1 FL=1
MSARTSPLAAAGTSSLAWLTPPACLIVMANEITPTRTTVVRSKSFHSSKVVCFQMVQGSLDIARSVRDPNLSLPLGEMGASGRITSPR